MSCRYWVVMPAAGTGRRMASAMAKQYLPLLDKAVIEWALAPFLSEPRISAIVVVLAADDIHWHTLQLANHPKIRIARGGAARSDSVRAGLAMLANEAHADDWVLVHDAARPCLKREDVNSLLETLVSKQDIGGLLATPVTDTLKRADAHQQVATTLERSDLWRALTPQMFRYELLQRAHEHAVKSGLQITDDAAAVEALGVKPRLIAGRADNLKITVPEDLLLAASVLTGRK